MKELDTKLWNEFCDYGSGFELEAERDFKVKTQPLIFHLKMYGLHYKDGYELVGTDLNKLLKQAIKDAQKSVKEYAKQLLKSSGKGVE